MDTKAIFAAGDRVRQLQMEAAVISQKNELLKREQVALLDSNSDIRKRLLDGKEDMVDVEKKHLTSIQVYEERGIALLEEIIERQEALKGLLKSVSETENQLSSVMAKNAEVGKEYTRIMAHTEEVEQKARKEQQELSAEIIQKRTDLIAVTKELNTARDENISVRLDTDERIKVCEKEERLISVRRNDLEIYETRLRKQYPDAKMVFTT